jgi:hypothetical protein
MPVVSIHNEAWNTVSMVKEREKPSGSFSY